MTTAAALSYLLPLRWDDDAGRLDDLTAYLRDLSGRCEVIVVDGSAEPAYDRHATAWRDLDVVHCRPDPDLRYLNGKVNGVVTGLRRTTARRIVIADDDIRYDDAALHAVRQALGAADLVVPQNVFTAWPWHARWDTARSLLNRALGNDYPGTLGIRPEAIGGGYDGDVLFENLELIRTVTALGGRLRIEPGLYVDRLPPSTRAFWSQRVRQAYDSLAQPPRLVAELALLPVGVLAYQHPIALLVTAVLAAATAEVGRRRANGAAVYPRTAALWAPAWLLERAVCSWIAVWQRLVHGGVRYAGRRIEVAAHSVRGLTRSARVDDHRVHEIAPPDGDRHRTA